MSHKRFLEGIRGYVNVPLKWFCNVTSYEGKRIVVLTGGCDWLSGSTGLLPEDLTKKLYLRICLMIFKEI